MYKNDLNKIKNYIPSIEKLNRKKILVTGATGLIGSAVTDFLLENTNAAVFASSRSEEKLRKRFSDTTPAYIRYSSERGFETTEAFDYIIHCAGISNPKFYAEKPAETLFENILVTKAALDLAAKRPACTFLLVSSSEVYGKKEALLPYKEGDLGAVDLSDARSCYPQAKRTCETLAAAYQKEYGVRYVIARPGHIYGPTADKEDLRASSAFFTRVLGGYDIVMKSAGTQLRSYCYVPDCVSALLTILLCGTCGSAYNISNPGSLCTIRQMAEAIAFVSGRRVLFETPTDAEIAAFNPMDHSTLDSSALQALGWQGIFDLFTGVEHTYRTLEQG